MNPELSSQGDLELVQKNLEAANERLRELQQLRTIRNAKEEAMLQLLAQANSDTELMAVWSDLQALQGDFDSLVSKELDRRRTSPTRSRSLI